MSVSAMVCGWSFCLQQQVGSCVILTPVQSSSKCCEAREERSFTQTELPGGLRRARQCRGGAGPEGFWERSLLQAWTAFSDANCNRKQIQREQLRICGQASGFNHRWQHRLPLGVEEPNSVKSLVRACCRAVAAQIVALSVLLLVKLHLPVPGCTL